MSQAPDEVRLTAPPVVISGVNLTEGGPLTVLRDCLAAARSVLDPEQTIIAVVHDRRLFSQAGVQFVEIPKAKSSWRHRLAVEYLEFKRLSQHWRPALWLSLHDASPLLAAGTPQAVYCHNSTPFFKFRLEDLWFEPKLLIFHLFYGLIYRFNLSSNALVIVQQDWLRAVFQRRFKAGKVLVAHPSVNDLTIDEHPQLSTCGTILLFPTLSRAFKNIETICQAYVEASRNGFVGELRVTIDGTENRYARFIARRFGAVPGIKLIGRQDRDAMAAQYRECTAVLFPSRLETWGLPITEAIGFDKPLLVADLPYARETVGAYDKALFLPASDWRQWGQAILELGITEFTPTNTAPLSPAAPFVTGWVAAWVYLGDEFALPMRHDPTASVAD